jgi:hypothetical protein
MSPPGDMALPLAVDRLDLDDVGAQIAQALRRERPRHGDRAIEHAIPGENAHHSESLLSRRPSGRLKVRPADRAGEIREAGVTSSTSRHRR